MNKTEEGNFRFVFSSIFLASSSSPECRKFIKNRKEMTKDDNEISKKKEKISGIFENEFIIGKHLFKTIKFFLIIMMMMMIIFNFN